MSTFTRRIPFLALALCGLFAAGQASAEIKIGVVNFEKLLEDCYRDFAPVYARLENASAIEPDQIIDGDNVVSRGTLGYFRKEANVK